MSGSPGRPGFDRSHPVWVAALASLLVVGSAGAQTNPAAQTLPYTQDFRTLAASSTTYPAGWQGWINGAPGAAFPTAGPTGNQALLASSSASTTTGGVHNYNGKIGPLDNVSNDFELCFAVNTTGFSGVVVSYEMATIRNPYDGTTNTRINEIALQYRVGTAGSWTTLAGSEYQNNTTNQIGSGVVTPQKIEYRSVTLPAACDNQGVVQLRWAQREISGAGSRPSFAIDNLAVQQPPPGGQAAGLELDGVNDYVTFGQAPALGVSTFTIETWFMRTGTGATTSTGSGGIAAIVPLMAKGMAEADASTVDMNFILGINTAGNVIAADYEEGTGQTSPGLNHPVSGTTPILNNVWYHAAATFDGTALRVYLNGVLEGTNAVGANRLPQSASIQHATLGTALNSTGGIGSQPLGLFQGRLDEARIWNLARSACDLVGAMNLELTSGTGLIARWGMSEGAGVVLGNSLSTPNGILMNGPTWVAGSPFNAPTTPAAPGGLTASAPDATHIQLAWTDLATTESGYEVERSTTGASGPFTLLATLAANATGYTDTPLSPSTEYCYQVRAISVCSGASPYSAVACATTPAPAPPNPPTGLAAAAPTYSQINLSWTDNSSDETSFEVERSTDGGASFTPLASLAANTTSYSDIGLTAATAYCYRVRAVSGIGPSGWAGPGCVTTPAFTNMALQLAGSTYVTFGDPAALDLAQFTVECWFQRNGNNSGTPSTTGTGGISDAIPLVAHGAPQSEGGNPPVDMNFMLGISNGTGTLCADFEEGAGGTGPIGLNHPIVGRTAVGTGWHHAAVTYDGSTWKLYLDGILDGANDINQPVCSNTIQQASLGTMLTSTGGANGFFDGRL
ncbi:MAG TPA: LamG-like jellyroll fold domain-containing protein, partial [Candidatus Eisenbacteria bacterium]